MRDKIKWILPVVLMGAITFLSGTPGPNLGPISFVGIDKVAHFCVFGALGVAFARCWSIDPVKGAVKVWLWSVLLTFLFGLGDELHQFTNPDRYFEWNDLLADTAGALFFSGLYCHVAWIRSILEFSVFGKKNVRSE